MKHTALHVASSYGHASIVEQLLLHGADVTVQDVVGLFVEIVIASTEY